MSQEISNLDKLTDKIYREGLEKADQKAEEIIKEAERTKENILSEANAEAERIIAAAKKEAALEKRSTESEIKLKSKQLISDLKNEISQLLVLNVIDQNIRESFADPKFLQKLILEITGYWKSGAELELKLPDTLRGKVDAAFEKNITDQVENLTITFNGHLTNGFRISKKSDTYEIAFSEDDFVELFRPYLKEKAQKFLYAEGS